MAGVAEAMPERGLPPRPLPCLRHLDRIADLAAGPEGALASELADARATPCIGARPTQLPTSARKFIENYGWLEVFGTRGHFESPDRGRVSHPRAEPALSGSPPSRRGGIHPADRWHRMAQGRRRGSASAMQARSSITLRTSIMPCAPERAAAGVLSLARRAAGGTLHDHTARPRGGG